jgi:hypothetical protein
MQLLDKILDTPGTKTKTQLLKSEARLNSKNFWKILENLGKILLVVKTYSFPDWPSRFLPFLLAKTLESKVLAKCWCQDF